MEGTPDQERRRGRDRRATGSRGGAARRFAEGGELPIGSSYVSYGALAWQPL